jgi:uncharacterized protein YdgA (DUF945 family)
MSDEEVIVAKPKWLRIIILAAVLGGAGYFLGTSVPKFLAKEPVIEEVEEQAVRTVEAGNFLLNYNEALGDPPFSAAVQVDLSADAPEVSVAQTRSAMFHAFSTAREMPILMGTDVTEADISAAVETIATETTAWIHAVRITRISR